MRAFLRDVHTLAAEHDDRIRAHVIRQLSSQDVAQRRVCQAAARREMDRFLRGVKVLIKRHRDAFLVPTESEG